MSLHATFAAYFHLKTKRSVMMRKKFIFLIVFTSALLGGCSVDDEPNFHFTALRIVSAELPESFELNESYQIFVDYELPNGCSAFEGFEVRQEDTTVRNVVAIGSIRTDTELCTDAIIEGQAFFNFVVIHDQPYTFKFHQGENSEGEAEYLEIVVPVN